MKLKVNNPKKELALVTKNALCLQKEVVTLKNKIALRRLHTSLPNK